MNKYIRYETQLGNYCVRLYKDGSINLRSTLIKENWLGIEKKYIRELIEILQTSEKDYED